MTNKERRLSLGSVQMKLKNRGVAVEDAEIVGLEEGLAVEPVSTASKLKDSYNLASPILIMFLLRT